MIRDIYLFIMDKQFQVFLNRKFSLKDVKKFDKMYHRKNFLCGFASLREMIISRKVFVLPDL